MLVVAFLLKEQQPTTKQTCQIGIAREVKDFKNHDSK